MRHKKDHISIGFWNNDRNDFPYLPNVKDSIDLSWDEREREAIALYLESGTDVEWWKGFSDCRVCHKFNGSTDKSDGKYLWPEGFAHYVREHGVKPPQEFIEHALSAMGKVLNETTDAVTKRLENGK